MKIFSAFLFFVSLTCALAVSAQPEPFVPRVRYKKGLSNEGYYVLFPYQMRKSSGLKNCMMQIMDGSGRVLLYKKTSWASDLKLHPNGLMSFFKDGKFYLMNSRFKVVDSVYCKNGVETDSHDFVILPDHHYLLIGRETITENRGSRPGNGKQEAKRMRIKYGVVQELDKDKNVVFEWSSRNTHKLEDADPFFLKDTQDIDLTHFNSVDRDEDGNIIVSARFFNEVFKIRRSDGTLLWRMGGKKNNMKVLNDSLPFYGQHDARFTGKNQFTVFDNGYSSDSLRHNVRVLEYVVNDSARTATVVWNYSNENRIISEATGNAQKLQNGSMLISYGKIENREPNIAFEVISPKKSTKLIQVYYEDTMATYRTYYYPSLPFTIISPKIQKSASADGILLDAGPTGPYLWSTGATTRTISVTTAGSYFVYLPFGDGAFMSSEVITIPETELKK